MFADLRRALGLLTVFPIPAPRGDTDSPGRAMAYYPLVGAVIGGILAGVTALLDWSGLLETTPLLCAAIVLAVWGGLTGGLHLDGWADCCDALFVPVDRERRLEIMKDPRLGGFGATGLVMLLLVKFAALQGIMARPHALLMLVAVAVVARWGAVVAAYAYPTARPGGMGDHFRRGLNWLTLLVATIIALAATAPLLLSGTVVWAAVVIACLLLALPARARLGGLTGDVYGAIIELGETLALVVLCFL
jgi:adenosylcobinamide-GDP ribazoletransferase